MCSANIGGYGIPAIPTHPLRQSPTDFTEHTEPSCWEEAPTDFTEHTEPSCWEEAPTDFTDLHRTFLQGESPTDFRLGGYGILPYPRSHQTIFPQKPQNLTQPNHLWASVKSVGEYHTPETSVNSVNSVEGLQRVAWVWQDAIPSYENSHRLHGCADLHRTFLLRRGSHRFHRFTQRLLVRRFCVLRVFCGSFYILT